MTEHARRPKLATLVGITCLFFGLAMIYPQPAEARESGRGCYCSGFECGDPGSTFLRWCCSDWPSSNCGCTLFVTDCVDKQS